MDPYRVLGVDRKATQDDIAKAYRSLAAKHHPDKNLGNVEEASVKFKEVTAAWEMIGTEEKRRRHDFLGGHSPVFSFRSRNAVDEVFDNLFSQFFGGQNRQGDSSARSRVRITLEEAFSGCSKAVKSEDREMCGSCTGTGSTQWTRCQGCGGSGFVFTSDGHMRIQTSCTLCSGRGSTPSQSCGGCNGRGYRVVSERDVEVAIPPGVEDGMQIRVPGEAPGGGDLFVVVSVDRHPALSRQGRNLLSQAEVAYPHLVLGGEVKVSLFGSEVSIKIPRGTKSGTRVRLQGQGMPHVQNPSVRGDLFVDLVLKVPSKVSKEHEGLLERLAKIESRD